MSGELSQADLDALTEWDTPTICNALEIVAPERRAYGFNRRPLVAPFPEMKPVVGYARTAGIRAREPYGRGKEEGRAKRLAYYDYIAKGGPRPSRTVIQDLDGPDIGFGAFWGDQPQRKFLRETSALLRVLCGEFYPRTRSPYPPQYSA